MKVKNMNFRQSKFIKIISLCLVLIFVSQQIGWAKVVDLRQGADGWDYALAVLAGVISAQGVKSDWGVLQTFTYTYVIPEVCDWAIDKGTSLKGKDAMYASIALSSLLQSRFDYSNSASRAATSALQKTAEKATTLFTKIYNYVKNFFKPITNFFGKYAGAWGGAISDSLTATSIAFTRDEIMDRFSGDETKKAAIGLFLSHFGGKYLGAIIRFLSQKAFGIFLGYDPKYGPTASKAEKGISRVYYRDEQGIERSAEVDLKTRVEIESRPMDLAIGELPVQEPNVQNSQDTTGENKVVIKLGPGSADDDMVLRTPDGREYRVERSEQVDSVPVWNEAKGRMVVTPYNQALKDQTKAFLRQSFPDDVRVLTESTARYFGAKPEEGILLSSFAGSTSAYGLRGDPSKSSSEKNSYSWTGFFKSMGEGALKGLISVGLQQASLKTKSPLHGAVVNMAASNVLQFAAIRRPLREQNEASQQQTQKIGERAKNILASVPIINMPFSWIAYAGRNSWAGQTAPVSSSSDPLSLAGGGGNFFTSYFKGKNPGLLYQLFSMSVTEANTDFYSFGRAAPYLNGNTAGFRWTSGNDVFFLSRYADYVKDVHNDGLLGGLMSQFVSSYHNQAVNNVYSVVTDGVNSLPFTKRLAPYQQRASSFTSLRRAQDQIIENMPELIKQNEEKQLAVLNAECNTNFKDMQELEKSAEKFLNLDEETLKENPSAKMIVDVYKNLVDIDKEFAQIDKDALKTAETKDLKRFGWAAAGATAATFWNPLAIMFINTPELEQDSMDSTLSERTNHIQAISRLLSPELIEQRGEQKQQENETLAGILPDGISKQAFLSTNHGPAQLFSELDKEQSKYDYYNGKTKVIEEDKGWQRLAGVYRGYYDGDLPQVVKDKGLVYDKIPSDVEDQAIFSTGEYKNKLPYISKTVEEETKGKITQEASRGKDEYINQRLKEEEKKINKEAGQKTLIKAKELGININTQPGKYQYLKQVIKDDLIEGKGGYRERITQEAEAKVNQEVSQVMIAPATQRQISNEAEKRALSRTKVDLSGSDLMGAVKYHRDWAEVNPVYEGRWTKKPYDYEQDIANNGIGKLPEPVPVIPAVPQLKPSTSADVKVREINYKRFNVGYEFEKDKLNPENRKELQLEIAKLKEINPDLSRFSLDISSSGGLLLGATDIWDGPKGNYDNVALAEKRRDIIKSFLIEQGIPEKNIHFVDTVGPFIKAPKEDYRGRQQDRTLDITVGYVSEGVVKESSLTPSQQQLLQQDSAGNKFISETIYNPVKTLPSKIIEIEYPIASDDTLSGIVFKMNNKYKKEGLTTSFERIKTLNNITDPKGLRSGQTIKVVME